MIEKVSFCYSDNITVINQEQFEAHIKLYEGYVNKINEIDRILKGNAGRSESNSTFSYFRECKRGETFALNGVILHELYFENIGSDCRRGPNQVTTTLLDQSFGNMKNWQMDFVATAKASRGWVVLCYDQRSCCFRNISLDAHDVGNIAYSAPVLVLDMYEHAYFLQYKTDKDEYISQFLKNINWQIVNERMSIF